MLRDRNEIEDTARAVTSLVFFQAEDGIRDAQDSRGLGDVYKRQGMDRVSDGVRLTRRSPRAA